MDVFMDDLEDDILLKCEDPTLESHELESVQSSTTPTLTHTNLASVSDGGEGKPCTRENPAREDETARTRLSTNPPPSRKTPTHQILL